MSVTTPLICASINVTLSLYVLQNHHSFEVSERADTMARGTLLFMAWIVCRLLLSHCGGEVCRDVEMRGIYLSGDEDADPVGISLLLLHFILRPHAIL